MRVCFFLTGLAMGGAERQTLDLMAGLEEWGWEVKLLVYGEAYSESFSDNPFVKSRTHIPGRGMSSGLGWKRLFEIVSRNEFPIIVTVNQTATIMAVIARALTGSRCKILSVFHSTDLAGTPEERRFWAFRISVALADGIIFVSERQRAYWKARGLWARREHVILNGIDVHRVGQSSNNRDFARGALGVCEDTVLLGVLASLRREKRVDLAIKALEILNAAGETARLVIIGDGPERRQLEELANVSPCAGDIMFTGEVSDIINIIGAVDIGILSSTSVETFSIAILEMLAAGIPVVATDIGGAREIIEDGVQGFVVPPGRAEAIADSVRSLLDKKERSAFSERALQRSKRFDRRVMIAHYVEIIGEYCRH